MLPSTSSFVASVQDFCNPAVYSLTHLFSVVIKLLENWWSSSLWLLHIQREVHLPEWVTWVIML